MKPDPARRRSRSLVRGTAVALRGLLRALLVGLGRRAGSSTLTSLRSVLSYLELGRWLDDLPPADRPRRVPSDLAVFEVALSRIGDRSCLYLEFGVFEGRTLRWWLAHHADERSRFVGFDVFSGLPEGWRELPAGHFATAGPPRVDDARASFRVGLFADTLPNFAPQLRDVLVINIDSDLYASAVTVLDWCAPYLRPGSLIYFDEFGDRDHEMRAYFEFTARTGAQLRPLAYARAGTHMLFEVVVPPLPASATAAT